MLTVEWYLLGGRERKEEHMAVCRHEVTGTGWWVPVSYSAQNIDI